MLAFSPFQTEAAGPRSSLNDILKCLPLRYEKLPDGEFFRVLKTISIDATCVRCSLTTASLEDPPSYVALSYTWGSASLGDKMTADKTKTIICNDSVILVTENLWAALKVIHSGDGYLWADAICINQDDLDELGTQVTKMGKIFSKAYVVIVWLGPADGDAVLADRTIRDFCKRYRAIEGGNRFIGDTSFWKDMGREPFSNEEANALAHFYSHLWFERMWVLQEVILATHIRVICGTLAIEWDDLVTMSIYLFNSGYSNAWHSLRTEVFSCYGSPLAATPVQMNKIREGCRDGVIIDDDVVIKLKDIHTPNIEKLFCKFLALMLLVSWVYNCDRPVDRVFAPLALSLHKFSGTIDPSLMVPDYSKSLEQVFTEVSTLVIQKTSELHLLTAVEDLAFRVYSSLPSWVPDFSVMNSSPLQCLKLPTSFDAMKGKDSSCSVVITGSKLTVRGYWIDTAIHRGPDHDHSFQISPSAFLEFALSLGEYYHTGEDAIRAFVRTFVADQLPYYHLPGMLHLFNAYVRYSCAMSKDMQGILEDTRRITGLQSTIEILRALFEYPESLPSWPVLDAFESKGASAFPTFRQLVAWLGAMAEDSYNNEDDRRCVDIARHLIAERHLDAISFRRLFKGRLGYIGLMPQSAQIGDELWIFPGCKTPCTLRSTKKKGVYRFLGEAYVHGVMHGEFWESEPHPDPSSIILE